MVYYLLQPFRDGKSANVFKFHLIRFKSSKLPIENIRFRGYFINSEEFIEVLIINRLYRGLNYAYSRSQAKFYSPGAFI